MNNRSCVNDPFDLNRFVDAQAASFESAINELRRGRKATHWMWFVLPQMRGLGYSSMSRRYGIGSLEEARAYRAHPVLGPRLVACIDALEEHAGVDPANIFGPVDAVKFQSCLTLFAMSSVLGSVFHRALDAHFAGELDGATLALLSESG